MSKKRDSFGTEPIGKLLRAQAIPASIGFLVMSVYTVIDKMYVGNFVSEMAIGAITVVSPITFLISSIGMAIGVGGASMISRSFGGENTEKAFATFGNQILLTLSLSLFAMDFGYFFLEETLVLFSAKGEIFQPAKEYFSITLLGVPFLAWAMMSNNVIRAEGYPRIAMFTLIIPAIANMILDPIFIIYLDMGIKGAAWATTISYIASALFTTFFFFAGKSQLKINKHAIIPKYVIIKEMVGLGSITFARQGVISILSIVLYKVLFVYGDEMAINAYGIIQQVMFFALFPVLGITQGTLPIVGYNHGANKLERVEGTLKLAITSASTIALVIFILIIALAPEIVSLFTNEEALIEISSPALRMAFAATPLIAVNLIGSGYFQAIGKAVPALLLTLTKQGFFLIPLVVILPLYFGLDGAWMAFPIADLGAALVTFIYFQRKSNVRLLSR